MGALSLMPFKGHERRKSNQDRRQNPRSGKLDRRRNHCVQCRYYAPQSDVAGVCQKHQTMIRADDYACVFFVEATVSPLLTSPEGDPPARAPKRRASDRDTQNSDDA